MTAAPRQPASTSYQWLLGALSCVLCASCSSDRHSGSCNTGDAFSPLPQFTRRAEPWMLDDTNLWVETSTSTYDLAKERRQQLRRAALSRNDLNAVELLYRYYVVVRGDRVMGDLWLKYKAYLGDPRARAVIDERRFEVSNEELRILNSTD